MVEFVAHFGVCVFPCETGFFAAFDDEFEALVEFVFDLLAVLQVFLGIFFKVFELFFTICNMSAIVIIV